MDKEDIYKEDTKISLYTKIYTKIYTKKYYPAFKKKERMPFATT